MALRYDEARGLSKVLIEIYGWFFVIVLIAIYESARLTCRFEIDGEDHLRSNPHAIWACWHEFSVCSLVSLPILLKHSNHQVWLNHPAWLLRPIHRLMGYYGISVIMGASGEGGRVAARELLHRVRTGESTSMYPDGPAGPKRTLKKGVLNLSRDAQLPILAFHYHVGKYWLWPSWDQKRVPLPFSKIKIRISEPLFVHSSPDHEDALKAKLEKLLSGEGADI